MKVRGALVLGLMSVCGLGLSCAGEFEPDEFTLLLAHFNERVDMADYAEGIATFSGNGATLTEGYFGKAIDLRPRGLYKNFWEECEDYTPRYDGWGFRARGNLSPWQGTFEYWIRVSDPNSPKVPSLYNTVEATLARSVKHPERDYYVGFTVLLNTWGFKYVFPTVSGNCFIGSVVFKDIPGFGRSLDPDEWHHFALCWSQGEMTVWLDGRLLKSFDMEGQLGLVLMNNPVRYVKMSDCVIDELRISNVVRYTKPFEPAWRDGRRPNYAFTGNPGARRFPQKLVEPPRATAVPLPKRVHRVKVHLGEYELTFDRRTGRLVSLRLRRTSARRFANGLLLWKGLEREPLEALSMGKSRLEEDEFQFEQIFEAQVHTRQRIREKDGTLLWDAELTNRDGSEVWLELLLSIPLPLKGVEEYFDGCGRRDTVNLPRRRDEYALTLPFVAVSGRGKFIGVGLDPRQDINDILSERLPLRNGGIIRQGTRLALSPGESFRYRFVVVKGEGEFGTLDAIERYHSEFPELYRLRPDVPIYSYMPATQHSVFSKSVDMKRQGYAGGFWGHGPGHDKGDEFGTPRWWNNPKLDSDKHYREYTRRLERMWRSIYDLRQYITLYYRQAYENFYPVRRFHICPDMPPRYIIEDIMPGYQPNEDPLCFGQYYGPIWNAYLVNEYNTPLGEHFRDQLLRYLRQTKGYWVGIINDMSHSALYRHNDPYAKRTGGRSFSRDLGTFVRKALGRRQRYQMVNSLVDSGHRLSVWSDGGAFSFTLCAYSASIAIEGSDLYTGLTGYGDYLIPARYLLGEKPFTAMTHTNDDISGRFVKSEELTPFTLRDYYRYCDRQLALFCLENGVTLDPTSYMWGRQYMLETAAVMVESAVLGRKIVPSATVKAPLWVRRSGDGLKTLLVVGNAKPYPLDTAIRVSNRYYGASPLFVPYYGGDLPHRLTEKITELGPVTVKPRDFFAVKIVGLLDTGTPADVLTSFSGDGITLRLRLTMSLQSEGELLLSSFAPLYRLEELKLNGERYEFRPNEPVYLSKGSSKVEVTYYNRSLRFTAADWKAVELIKDGRVNFCLLADPGVMFRLRPEDEGRAFALGFERGTARMLNDFIEQYDSEDGVPGNLKPAQFVRQKPKDYEGWALIFKLDHISRPGYVTIHTKERDIRFSGATQGELRRAMVVFMRLVDRKYPHIGRFFPLKYSRPPYELGKPVPIEKWVARKPTAEFFKKMGDPFFLIKPLLRREFEVLYKENTLDFEGKYTMKWSPYIFEPTFDDDFVYGYYGPGTAETMEQLRHPAQ